ncbi:MAG: RNA-guided endonuclease IscB [Syntrophobacteraceae bacterium]|jgi:hypothetical protein
MLVYVRNQHGKPLMPCHPVKARMLLKQGKAKAIKRTPFTIQILYGSSGYRQPVTLGVDSGYVNIGLSSVTAKEEVYSANVMLRNDIVKLNSERRTYRKSRRNRKTWHRQPRFLNRKKPEGWLAPSIHHKLDSHIKLVDRVNSILPVSKVIVEVAAFDIQKIKNSDISGAGYQDGEQKGFLNVREYVLYRDGHRCRYCKGKSGDLKLEVHHAKSRQTGGDRPENLATLCKTCHGQATRGEIVLKIRPSKGFKAETFMSMVRWNIVGELRNRGYNVEHTYGYLTKLGRKRLGLPKSHVNDAFVMANGTGQTRSLDMFVMHQVRKCNRKLFKGIRSHIPNTAPREIFGFRRFDKVRFEGSEGFIFGRRSTGYFDIQTLDGTKLHASAKHSDLVLLERASTLLIERRNARIDA